MMEGRISNSNNGAVGAELSIAVTHGPNQHQVAVPADSTFGDLKSAIAHKIGLKPETCKLLFRGKEKEDDDNLQAAGVKDSSKVLIMEETTSEEEIPVEVEPVVVSRGGEAVAIVREEVDKLADQVAALQAVVDGGTKVDDKDFIYLSEMLMRQLLKLDGIEAEGEGRVQRRTEVRRVQSFVETVDILKSRNANHDDSNSNNNGTESTTTPCKTFESGSESLSTESTETSPIATFQSSDPPQSLLGSEAVEAAASVPPKLYGPLV